MKRIGVVIGLILLMVLVGAVIYTETLPQMLAPAGELTLSDGDAVITPPGGDVLAVTSNVPVKIRPQTRLDIHGIGSLTLASTTLDVIPGVIFVVREHRWSPVDGWRVEVELLAGQIRARFQPADKRLQLKLFGPNGIILVPARESAAEIQMNVREDTSTDVAVLAGRVTAQGEVNTVILGAGEAVSTPRQSKAIPGNPTPWASLSVPLYRADMMRTAQLIQLTEEKSGVQYAFSSDWTFLAPPGTYSIRVDVSFPYQVPHIQLQARKLSIVPIVVGEFELVLDPAIRNTTLNVNTRQRLLTMRGGESMLISPGIWSLEVATADKPDLVQDVQVNVQPGQKQTINVDARLFGGAALRVALNSEPVPVRVFLAGAEDKDPIAVFRSDQASQVFPQGRYVVSVMTQPVAARFEVTIEQSKQQVIEVPFGALRINYQDSRRRPLLRNVIIIRTDALQRAGKSIAEVTGGDPVLRYYRLGTVTNQVVSLPAGRYTVLVDDANDIIRSLDVDGGETTELNLTLGQ